MRRGWLKECRKRTVKENPEYSVSVKMMKPEARNIAIVVGNLSTEVGGVEAKSDRRRWVAWDAGPNEQSRDGIGGADSCASCASEEGRERKESVNGQRRIRNFGENCGRY